MSSRPKDLDDALDVLLAAAAIPVRGDAATRDAVVELSALAAARTRPRLRRGTRIAIGVAAGTFALGGVSAAAAGTDGIPWPVAVILDADASFDILLSDGTPCHYDVRVLPDGPMDGMTVAQISTVGRILDELDVADLDPDNETRDWPVAEAQPAISTERWGYADAISLAVREELRDRGMDSPEQMASYSMEIGWSCADQSGAHE